MTVAEIIKELASTTKTNEKIEILQHHSQNMIFVEILKACYSDKNYYLTKLDDFTNTGSYSFETASIAIFKLLDALAKRDFTGNNARELVNSTMGMYDEDTQEIFKNILKHDLRCAIGVALINKALGYKLIDTFKVQLCNKYDESKKYKTVIDGKKASVVEWAATPKMDGIRCYWQASTPDVLYSRSGKTLIGLEHIIKDIKTLYEKYSYITFLDGELFTNSLDFNDIQGTVTSTVNYENTAKESIKYNIFAVGNENEWVNPTYSPTVTMYQCIDYLFKEMHLNSLNFVTAELVKNNPVEIKKLAKKYVDNGYEGIVLRDLYNWYEYKRSDALVKFKFFKEEDFTVTGMVEGTGKYTGMLGALIVEGDVDGHCIKAEVGTGLVDEDRKEFWDNKSFYIGKKSEVKYQDISQNANGEYSLRFPIFKGFKLDR